MRIYSHLKHIAEKQHKNWLSVGEINYRLYNYLLHNTQWYFKQFEYGSFQKFSLPAWHYMWDVPSRLGEGFSCAT